MCYWDELELLNELGDLQRENRRMRWVLSVRLTDPREGTTLLDEYKELTEEFWERQGL